MSRRHEPTLTLRERQIVDVMLTGSTNKTIAKRLDIAEQTVKNRLTVLYRKFGVTNRLELVLEVMHRRQEVLSSQLLS